jgi:hypothetical protein
MPSPQPSESASAQVTEITAYEQHKQERAGKMVATLLTLSTEMRAATILKAKRDNVPRNRAGTACRAADDLAVRRVLRTALCSAVL